MIHFFLFFFFAARKTNNKRFFSLLSSSLASRQHAALWAQVCGTDLAQGAVHGLPVLPMEGGPAVTP